MTTKEKITLYYKDSRSDKFYTIGVVGEGEDFSVPFTHGRRGTSGQCGFKNSKPLSYEKAKKIYDKVVKEKLAKGYKPGEGMDIHEGITTKIDTGIYPQLLNIIEESEVEKYLNNDLYGAQEKKDGRRKFLKCNKGIVTSINRKGQEVGYPAVFKEACLSLEDNIEDFILDGEEVGEILYVFDIIRINGADLHNLPYEDRYKNLEYMMSCNNDNSLKIVPLAVSTVEKKALYKKLKKEGKEGIVFKNLSSLYIPGRPNSAGDQLKFKFYSAASCIVIKVNDKRSIALGLYSKDELINVGNCTIPANFKMEEISRDDIVEIRYLYAYEGGSLYQPVYLGLRDDIEREACIIEQLKYKGVE